MTIPPGIIERTRTIVAAARDQGRGALFETEALEILEGLGFGVPDHTVIRSAAEADAVDLPGDRVVVKIVSSSIAHKAAAGGVAVVTNSPAAIRGAVDAMTARFSPAEVSAYLVAEYLDHAGELLVGLRWTDAFGPVVSLGVGGAAAERSGDPAVMSAAGGRDRLTERIERVAVADSAVVPLLTDLAAALMDFGVAVMPDLLAEIEVNPLVVTATGPVALDALARTGDPLIEPEPARPLFRIDRLLHPRSIAVMGVSERMNPGRMILENIRASGFPPDDLIVIKPGVAEVGGCRAVPDVASLDGPVDLLILAVAAAQVPAAIADAIAGAAAEAVIVIPGGLGEVPGSEGLAAQVRDSLAASRRTEWGGPVVVGPNSMGVRSGPGRFDSTFIPPERLTPAAATEVPVAVIAQSGAFTLSRLDRLPWLRPRYLVTVGNQLDLSAGDYLEFFAADPDVSIVACYLEGLRPGDGRRMLDAAAAIRSRGGTVLLARGGKTASGARSALTHTAAIATDDVVVRELAAGAGIVEAATLDEFEDLLRLAVAFSAKPVTGRRVGALSNAGFECVAMADALGPLVLADFHPETVERLTGVLGAGRLESIVGVQNPVDLTPIAGDETFAAAVEAVLDDPGVDLGVVGCVPYTAALGTLPEVLADPGSVVQRLAALAAHPTPWVVVVDGGARYDPMVAALEAAGLAVFRTVDRALRLCGRYATRTQAKG